MAAEVVYDPTEVRLKPVRNMTEARDNIIGLLKCALRQDDIDLGIDGYALPVKYKGQETVLAV